VLRSGKRGQELLGDAGDGAFLAALRDPNLTQQMLERLFADAARLGRADLVRLAAEQGANEADIALYSAAGEGHLPIVEWVWDYATRLEAPVVEESVLQETLNQILLDASEGGHSDVLEWAVNKGADDFNYAVWKAVRNGHPELLPRLLELGADDYDHVMQAASSQNYPLIVNDMLAKGATNYNSALSAAALGGNVAIFDQMLALGANDYGMPLGFAARGGHIDLVRRLVALGAPRTSYERARRLADGKYEDIVAYLDSL